MLGSFSCCSSVEKSESHRARARTGNLIVLTLSWGSFARMKAVSGEDIKSLSKGSWAMQWKAHTFSQLGGVVAPSVGCQEFDVASIV